MKILKFIMALAYSISRFIWRTLTVKRYRKYCYLCDVEFKTIDKHENACPDCRFLDL